MLKCMFIVNNCVKILYTIIYNDWNSVLYMCSIWICTCRESE